jgi:hypothetical protein
MDTIAIVVTCVGATVVAIIAFVAHRRLAGLTERPGCISMIAFVIGWLAALTALITGLFLIAGRSNR